MSTLASIYGAVENAFFEPVTADGVIKDFDNTFDVVEDKDEQGRVDYDNNLLEQIAERQARGLLPQFDGIDWDKISESNKNNGLEDFYGGIDGGTIIHFLGDWFTEETENVIPDFSKFIFRRMQEDEDGMLTDSDVGALYLDKTPDSRLIDCFKANGEYTPQNEQEAIIASWLECQDDERRLLFFQYLDKLQNLAKEQQSEFKKAAAPVYLEVEGGRWQMMPSGISGGVSYRWRLERGGIKIGIHSDPKGHMAPVMVEFGYQALKFRKFPDVVAEVETALKAIGFNIIGQRISRIDLQLTLGLPFIEVAKAYTEGRFVTRARKFGTYVGVVSRCDTGNETQTEFQSIFTQRNGKINIRLYDKIKECFSKSEGLEKLNDLYAIMGVREHLTRIEFELHREWLKEYQINTVTEFYAHLPEIIRYLTQSYFRVVEDEKTTHTEKQKNAPWWDDVQSKFELAFNASYEGKALQRIETKIYSSETLVKQALGCLRAALACIGGETMDRHEFHKSLWQFVRLHESQLYDDYVKTKESVKIQLEPITRSPSEFDYSQIAKERVDLMIDETEEEEEGL